MQQFCSLSGISAFFLIQFKFSAVKIAGDLLDLVGDGAFETVQDLLSVSRKPYCKYYIVILPTFPQGSQ